MELNLKIAVCEKSPENVPDYLSALKELGAVPAVVNGTCRAADYDGLLLPGGVDLAPQRYGQENRGSLGVDEELDELQFSVLDRFVQAGKPIFGICRGHQLLNVYFGGTLIQHLPTSAMHTGETDVDPIHPVTAAEGSFMQMLYGSRFIVNSTHHQASGRIGDGLVPVLRAEDGTVEAAYHERLPIWSVQWHPERTCFGFLREDAVDGSRVLEFFLNRCSSHYR